MSYLRQLRAVVWKDLVVELRTRERLLATGSFVVLTGLLFNYAVDRTLVRPQDIAAGLTWMTIVFSALLAVGRTFQLEAQDDAFQGVLLSPIPRDALFFGKVLSNYAIVLVVILLVMAVFGLFFALDWGQHPFVLVGTLALGGLGFVAIGTLFSAVSSGTAIGQTLLPVLLFPLLVPVVIYGTSATGRLLLGRPLAEVEGNLRILGGFALVALAAGATLFRYVVED